MMYNRERIPSDEKIPTAIIIPPKIENSKEVEPRLNSIIPSDLRRCSSDDHLLSRESMSRSKLTEGVIKEFDEYNLNFSPTPQENGNSPLAGKDIVQFGIWEQNKLHYLLHPDEWAKLVLNNWRNCKPTFEEERENNNEETKESNKCDFLKNSLMKDLDDFLSSYLPKIKDELLYTNIIKIIDSIDKSEMTEKFKDHISIFIVHQFRYDNDETIELKDSLELNISEKEYMEWIYKPFSSKTLKDEYEYLILKLKDYSSNTVTNQVFERRYLADETIRKEFINRWFFSNIEKLLGKLEEIKLNKDLFYLIIMKILPMMSEKQQKNLNKVMLKSW